MQNFDSQFSDKLIIKVYKILKENFPKIEKFQADFDRITITDDKFAVVEYNLPDKSENQFLEAYPGK